MQCDANQEYSSASQNGGRPAKSHKRASVRTSGQSSCPASNCDRNPVYINNLARLRQRSAGMRTSYDIYSTNELFGYKFRQ